MFSWICSCKIVAETFGDCAQRGWTPADLRRRREREADFVEGRFWITSDAGTKQILGAAILGTGGDEAIHCILDIMYARARFTTIQRAVHIHPTVSELIPTMLGDLKPLS